MLFLSSELSKVARDYARIENAAILSKSIQYYSMTYGVLPESGKEFDVATMLYEEQILFDILQDPVSLSATIKIDDAIGYLGSFYSGLTNSLNTDFIRSNYEQIKTSILDYFNLTYSEPTAIDTSNSYLDDLSTIEASDSLNVLTKNSNYPLDCVIVYRSDNSTNSYEISVCLESDFFMNKKKWDGGNDALRYEIGSDLRLNTEILVLENGKITSSENSSIFK